MAGTNHDWLWHRYRALCAQRARPVTALDFGCGDGELLTRSRREKLGPFSGVETYYGHGAGLHPSDTPAPDTADERIAVVKPGDPLPYPDDSFDFVCSNQVFEHVADLESTAAELARVTRPDGLHLHTFPSRERVLEGHLGVPLIHRIPQPARRAWAGLWYRRAYFSDQTDSFEQWWGHMGEFLASHTYYRPARAYDAVLRDHFQVRHVERSKLAFHLGGSRLRRLEPLTRVLPRRVELVRAGAAVELTLPREPVGAR